VTLIRHGQTEWNLQGRFQGAQDSPLTDRGIAQARATRARVASLGASAVYTSDLLRARRTAELLTHELSLPPRVEPRLRERSFGLFEGKTTEEMRSLHPAEFAHMKGSDPAYAMLGGESKADVLARLCPFLAELTERHAGEHVVLVSHGATLSILFKHVLQLPPQTHCNWELHNLGVSTMVYKAHERSWKLRTLSDVSHLDAVGLSDV
jgi:probable phosphoglycerate mutase